MQIKWRNAMNSLCKVKGFHVAPHIRPILPQLWPSAGHRTPCLAARTIQGEAGGKIADMSDSDIEVSEELNRDNLRVVLFSARPYVSEHFQPLCQTFPRAEFIDARLDYKSARLARNVPVISCFVNDDINARTVERLARGGTRLIAMRCAGFDRVDLEACGEHGIKVVRVPTYSPNAVAEHAVGLMLALNRRIHRAYNRTREGNFTLNGLVGFDMKQATVGVVGTGAIGSTLCRILKLGFGSRVLAFDVHEQDDLKAMGVEYVPLEDLLRQSDIVSLHVPLIPSTERLINKERIQMMKPGAMLINVSRGGLIDTDAVLHGLETGCLGAVGLDVFETESSLFFEDWSPTYSGRLSGWDRRLSLLTSLPNVIVTPHSAFLTKDALANIVKTTIDNIDEWLSGKEELTNEVRPRGFKKN